jgi:uncharacterized protein
MKIEDSFTLQAPPETVWAFLLDVEHMSQCMPGVEGVAAIDDNSYRGRLKIKIGPIAAAFDGTVTFDRLEPPNHLAATIAADDRGSASSVKAGFTSTLLPVPEGTQVSFAVDLNLRGRLAQFGLAVVRGTARKMTAQFSECVQKSLQLRNEG